jgi:lysylphosphatidylglycerol synthetase-like protein (DUF2156 family)
MEPNSPMISPSLKNFLNQYGKHTLSYSTCQSNLLYFETPDGYITYKKMFFRFGIDIVAVLGDPICAEEKTTAILNQFTEKYPAAHFFQVNKTTSKALNDQGYFCSDMGKDHLLSLRHFEARWHSHNSLVRARNKARRHGVTIKEAPIKDISRMKFISDKWLANKAKPFPNHSFLTRPQSFEDEPNVRLFFAYVGTQMVGYRIFDPVFRNQVVQGYHANINRVLPEAPSGTSYLLALHAIETFKKEGIKTLSMGLAPFSRIQEHRGDSSAIRLIFKCVYQLSRWIYPFKGIENFKTRFHGTEETAFFASRSRVPFLALWAVYKLICARPTQPIQSRVYGIPKFGPVR